MDKKNAIPIIICLVIILGLSIFIAYDKVLKKEDNTCIKEVVEKKEETKEEEPEEKVVINEKGYKEIEIKDYGKNLYDILGNRSKSTGEIYLLKFGEIKKNLDVSIKVEFAKESTYVTMVINEKEFLFKDLKDKQSLDKITFSTLNNKSSFIAIYETENYATKDRSKIFVYDSNQKDGYTINNVISNYADASNSSTLSKCPILKVAVNGTISFCQVHPEDDNGVYEKKNIYYYQYDGNKYTITNELLGYIDSQI